MPGAGERERELDGYGGFTNAAFTGKDLWVRFCEWSFLGEWGRGSIQG